MPMNAPPSRQSGPMQGLAAARPAESQGAEGGGPEQLVQAAGALLEDAVAQFGPEIVMVLKEMLAGPSAPGGAEPEGDEGMGGMM